MNRNTVLQLPPADEYQRAILNPGVCFADPELKSGQPHINTWGLPLPWSGQFACVFRIKTRTGLYAVRCFTSQVTDQQDRYAAFHGHVLGKSLPMLADFDYQPQGVLVKGVWQPIVKMEWVEGEPLDRAVERLCAAGDAGALRSLAEQWLVVAGALQAGQIAHGDLQHDNILVSNGLIRLVDYDGVYVPSLHSLSGLEMGHVHYQHPARKLSDYGPAIDNFSSLVIYLSLRALAADPALWERFHQDKHLILRSDDFKLRHESPLFLELSRSRDAEVCRLSLELIRACGSGSAVTAPALPALITQLSQPAVDWRKSWSRLNPAPDRHPSGALPAKRAPVLRPTATAAPAMRWPAWRMPDLSWPAVRWRSVDLASIQTPAALIAVQQQLVSAAQVMIHWLTRCAPMRRAAALTTLLVLLTVGVGGGFLAGYLTTVSVAPFWQSLLFASVLPASFIATRSLRSGVLAHLAMVNVHVALLGQWNWPVLWYALISGVAVAGLFRPLRKREIRYRNVLDAMLIGLLVRFVAELALLGYSPGWSELISSLLAALPAALIAITAGKTARTAFDALEE